MIDVKGSHFEKEIILWGVRWVLWQTFQTILTIGASSPLMKSRTYENGRTQKKSLFAQFPGILATARNCPYS